MSNGRLEITITNQLNTTVFPPVESCDPQTEPKTTSRRRDKTLARVPEFLVRNRKLDLVAAIPLINGCSGRPARRFLHRFFMEPTDWPDNA